MDEPKQTCPAIDECLDSLKTAMKELECANKMLEVLRKQNEELRTFGKYWKKEHDELDKEFTRLMKEKGDLQLDLQMCEEEVRMLKHD